MELGLVLGSMHMPNVGGIHYELIYLKLYIWFMTWVCWAVFTILQYLFKLFLKLFSLREIEIYLCENLK